MVVLAASICTKAGKAVMSRQFVEMPRSRIEGLLASFPKLIGTSDQHTFVETETVRYVYQPLEDLYMVLVTNKHSNILQDIDTLHLFARLVSEYCRSLNEREIALQAFELAHVFDEVVSLGYRENVNIAQIRTITEMESHEERVQAEIARNQEKQAKEDARRKARMMEMQKREMAKMGYTGGAGGFGGGFGSGGGSYGGSGPGGFRSGSPYEPVRNITPEPERSSYSAPVTAPPAGGRGKGMQLGRKQNDAMLVNTIKADEGIPDVPPPVTSPTGGIAAPVHHPAVPTESVHVALEEKIIVVVNRDGGLQDMKVKGEMQLKVTDPAKGHLRVALNMKHDPNVQYNTHPQVDKKLFADSSILGVRDPSKPFPTNQALNILRWRFATNDESQVPLLINCWPSPSGTGSCDVNIEYELQSNELELRDVIISIPYPGNTPPTVGDVEGHYEIDRARRFIQWQLPIIDQSNKSGLLEFSVNTDDTAAFFPIVASFTSGKTFCSIGIRDVTSVNGAPISFSQDTVLLTEDYKVV
ncbi:coatomer subunit delta [Spizellomyces punctatus DAOM BR117]|uniref:Coatomer subunit delta n=1 Tax=Spizellomyces punctatus (strain DAOM BR117) TaxID=645134 RepID=A0A0L0H712_SPIPD|nr:coatomer subunit delta [Spizellomyces punctatus DAOM BR117]KNC96513.1 hypothetical protein SPPG_08102 [Spizellomyces punctatus DAOM BR117]|eukprot:XP_016604553.1 hypothetical protein SPPG_08102 [Spizellomyces punctatus DAOM BR117]